MKIIQDTREQTPLDFCDPLVTETLVEKLDVGDYRAEYKNGFRPNAVFERKSISDLFGTLGAGYPRFKRAVQRGMDSDTRVILIVEGTISDVILGDAYSTIDGNAIIKTMFSLWVRYDVFPVFCMNRLEMSKYIVGYYAAIGRKAMNDMRGVFQ